MAEEGALSEANGLRQETAATVLIRCRDAPGKALVIRRPTTPDEELPGLWGLPAASRRAGETMEEAAHRIGPQKLGAAIRLVRPLASGRLPRQGYELHMTLYEAEMDAAEPLLTPRDAQEPGITYYTDWRWAEPSELKESARRGSLCSRLLLGWLGDQW